MVRRTFGSDSFGQCQQHRREMGSQKAAVRISAGQICYASQAPWQWDSVENSGHAAGQRRHSTIRLEVTKCYIPQ